MRLLKTTQILPALRKNGPLFKDKPGFGAGFHDVFHCRCQPAAEHTLVIKEFNDGHTRLLRPCHRRIRIAEQRLLMFHDVQGIAHLLTRGLLRLQLLAHLHQDFRVLKQVRPGQLADTGFLLGRECRYPAGECFPAVLPGHAAPVWRGVVRAGFG